MSLAQAVLEHQSWHSHLYLFGHPALMPWSYGLGAPAQGKLCIGLAEQTLLVFLAQALSYALSAML